VTGSLLIINGTMGAGKTAVLGEASDILAQRGIVHAAMEWKRSASLISHPSHPAMA